jgi:hypothetical protein
MWTARGWQSVFWVTADTLCLYAFALEHMFLCLISKLIMVRLTAPVIHRSFETACFVPIE